MKVVQNIQIKPVRSSLQQNDPPSKPTISGETKGTTKTEYGYSISSIDQDNDTLKYQYYLGR